MNEKNKSEENLEEYDVVDESIPLWARTNYHDSEIFILNRTMVELVKVCGLFLNYHNVFATAGYRVSADGLSLSPYIEFRANEDNKQGMLDLAWVQQFFLISKSEYLKRFHIGEVEFLQDSISFQITARMDGSIEGMRKPENELLGFAINELWVRHLEKDNSDPTVPSDYLKRRGNSIRPICHQTNEEAEDKLFSLCRHIVDGTATSIEVCGYHDFECKRCSIKRETRTVYNYTTNICYPCFVKVYTNWRRKHLGVSHL